MMAGLAASGDAGAVSGDRVHALMNGQAATTRSGEAPFPCNDDGGLSKSGLEGDTLPEPRLDGRAGMIVPPAPVPGEPATAMVPEPLDELLKIAGEFSEKGRFSEAERILDHVLSAAPEQPVALHQKGVLLFRMGSHQAAAEMIERSVGLAPDAIGFRRNLCPIFERLGRYDDALRVGYQAFERDP